MSFKEKIIQYCKDTKYDCENCPFRTPCDTANKNTVPEHFADEQIECLRKEIFAEYRRTCKKLSKMINFLLDLKKEEKHEPNNL